MGALLATMAKTLVEDADSIRNLCIISGCSTKEVQRKVVELYSPPRVNSELRASPSQYLALQAGPTLDLHADEHGEVYDFLESEDRQRCRESASGWSGLGSWSGVHHARGGAR